MKLSSTIELKKSVFREQITEMKENCCDINDLDDSDTSSVCCICCKKFLKTVYINQFQTDYFIKYEKNKFVLCICMFLPKLIYNTQETITLTILEEFFDDIDEIIDRYYLLTIDLVKTLMEKKLQEYFVYHTDTCSLLECENPGVSNCPQCSYFLCVKCLNNMNMNTENNTYFCCPQCRFKFYR